MNKRGLVIAIAALVALAMTAFMGGCSQQSAEPQSKDSLNVSTEPIQEEEPVVLRTDPFYVLVVGSDSREGTVGKRGQYADGKGRSDTCMLVRVDPKNYKLTLVTVPRDTTIELDGKPQKINESFHQGGIKSLEKEIKKLTGVSPDYYLITTFVDFQKIVDAMGGIQVDVPVYETMQDIVSGDTIEFDAGEQTLNGAEALIFARDRHSYDWSGNAEPYRQTNDRYILRIMIQQILAKPSAAEDLAYELYPYIESDLTDRELAAYVADFAENAKKVEFESYTGPYDGSYDYENDIWLAYRDEDTWKAVIDAIENGDDASEIVPIVSALNIGGDESDEGEGAEGGEE